MNGAMVSPCGLYCGVCGILQAHQKEDDKLKGKLARAYGVSAADIRCDGCLSDDVFVYCRVCPIKQCAAEKGFPGCHQCDAFPCPHVENFPVPEGKKVILRAIPACRRLGTGDWVEGEKKRYTCTHCGTLLFRGARRCGQCEATFTEP